MRTRIQVAVAFGVVCALLYLVVGGDETSKAPTLEVTASEVLDPSVAQTVEDSTRQAPAVVRGSLPEGSGDQAIGLKWSIQPPELQVYRATAVHLRVDALPLDHEDATCLWTFGDGTPSQEGCRISHTYHGGQADQVVTLKLTDGDWTWTTSRPLRLERLPVVHGLLGEGTASAEGLPSAPPRGETNLRMLIASGASTPKAVETATDTLKPDLFLHLGPLSGGEDDRSFEGTLRETATPLAKAGVPWSPALSTGDLSTLVSAGAEGLPMPQVRMVDSAHFPKRYSFALRGAFFLVISTGKDGVREEEISWMRDQLSTAGVYAARYVISPLPLHKFSDSHQGSLNKRFRLYELFLRGRVTALISGTYRVFFRGRYGALPVVSVGPMKAPGGTLSGQDFAQSPSMVMIDQVDGVPVRITAVEGPSFDRPLDGSTLPDAVEVYTR